MSTELKHKATQEGGRLISSYFLSCLVDIDWIGGKAYVAFASLKDLLVGVAQARKEIARCCAYSDRIVEIAYYVSQRCIGTEILR